MDTLMRLLGNPETADLLKQMEGKEGRAAENSGILRADPLCVRTKKAPDCDPGDCSPVPLLI